MKDLLQKYAALAVKAGVNIQKDQLLVINAPIECAPFARLCMEEAYKAGAKDVYINWNDEQSAKVRYMCADISVFQSMYSFVKDVRLVPARLGAAFLAIIANDPDVFKDVDPLKIQTAQKTNSTELKEFIDRQMSNQNRWTVITVPAENWAKKVFPGDDAETAVKKLWEQIFTITGVYKEDAVQNWKTKQETLQKYSAFMNGHKFKSIRMVNSRGTDLTIELPQGHIWSGGGDIATDGVPFMPNIPTEEVFSLPKRNGVNGTVFSTKPLSYSGQLIDDFKLTFKDGRVVDFSAKIGYETLKLLIETDEGSHYLGEVALVPHDSPISKAGLIFYNTLYDENASCHLALGRAYLPCLENSSTMSEKELSERGVNQSLTHVDFMVGSSDLSVTGINKDGNTVVIFKDGNWAV
jgi:aminopeptidase